MRKIITMIFIAFSCGVIAQPQNFTADSIDSEYGIEYYKRYNSFLGGEEQRMCNGSPCNEQIEDQYKNGKLLHKGYYTEGQLVTFKNYYPDGTVERDFKRVSPVKCKIAKYYPDGKPKSEVTYFNGNPIEWTDYYPSGQVEFNEEYDRNYQYYELQESFYKNGQHQFVLELEKKRKMLYSKKEYYEDGTLKAEGEMKFNEATRVYMKINWWTYYNEQGEATVKKEYVNNGVVTEKEM
ncbi:toxin-antitoxin system YwqK family antitoxin [Salibacter halophilus]|uniref:Toxin-antitoxin system YwqK family antitoxin n=1 Tax=Salibacter halophilus TaxID=1803916 RepID=A0A6N6M7W0_9FLAO|nr:hypothetical protein [Salibacter halophilus]KAB1064730.1 hypothetical protein F3059_05080 [Salibacter halophilus]